jgi:di/tricarboxylate transporter
MMADQLNQLGFIPWLSHTIANSLGGLSITSTENQTNVFQAPVSFKISFQSNTPVISNKDNAIKAVKKMN